VLNSICDFGLFKAATHTRRKVSCEDIRHMSQNINLKVEASHKANAPFKVARPISGIVSILPMIWRMFSVFSQGISGDLWRFVSGWRSFFSPWRCGMVGMFIMLIGGVVWFRIPAEIIPVQTVTVVSQPIDRMPTQRFKIDIVKTNSDVMPAQTDTLLVHGTTDREKIKPDVIEQPIERMGSFEQSGSLARVDIATPAIDREIAKAMETALRQQHMIYAKHRPTARPTPVIKKRLAIARIDPVGRIQVPPTKLSDSVSAFPSQSGHTQVAVKNTKRNVSPILLPSASSRPVASPPEKPGPDPNFLLTAIQRGDVDTVRESLSRGVNPDIIFSETSTALTMAVDRGQIAMVDVLLDKGAAINQPTPSGETALMKSVWAGHEVITDLLLRRGAEVNAQNREGWTPLFYGSVMGRRRIVKRLLECGARLDLVDRDGRAPLMAAAWNGHAEVVRYLLAHGAPPNIQDRDGWTPLMFAAFEGHTDVVQALISQGANLRQKNNRGQSSAALATNRGHAELYAMISTLTKH
jgi:ankyrin repeat protein